MNYAKFSCKRFYITPQGDCLFEENSRAATSEELDLQELALTLSWRRPLSYRNQSIDLQSKSMDLFLYDNGLRDERVKGVGLRAYL